MKLVCLLLLVIVGLTTPTIIVQSTLTTTIVTTGHTVAYAGYFNTNDAGYLGAGTDWIWDQYGDLSPKGTKLTFQSLFYMSCGSTPLLNISAEASFVAYFDGVQIGSGNNWKTIYSFNLTGGCGSHNLTIVVTRGSDSGAGLIFTVSQDQSNCFNCGSNGFWNSNVCQCQCLSSCGCTSPQTWTGYPTCACQCPSLIIRVPVVPLIASQTPISNIFLCPFGQVRSPTTCTCQCVEQWCPPRYYWNPTPSSCGCYAILT